MKLIDKISAGVLLIASVALAHAQDNNSMKENIYSSCVMSADFESPYGESDLKGDQKLQDYCKCLALEVTPKIEKVIKAVKENPSKAKAAMQEMKESELASRNACRKRLNLPAAQAQ